MEANFRFGTTTGPCRISSENKERQTAEEYEREICDPEKLLQCPYDKNHQIRVCRFPYHLIKCKKNHPKLANELRTCPFNARHLVPKHELAHHTETCGSRISVDNEDAGSADGRGWHLPVSTWVNPEMTEDWEKEADKVVAPFVWGVHTAPNQKPDGRPTNNLDLASRPPSTIP